MKPTAAPSRFPYVSHRNMAQVMAEEERLRKIAAAHRQRELREPMPLNRTPCPQCGVRADYGCKHSLAVAL